MSHNVYLKVLLGSFIGLSMVKITLEKRISKITPYSNDYFLIKLKIKFLIKLFFPSKNKLIPVI